MKRHKLLAVVATAALLTAGSLQAKEKKSAAGGLELSGNVDVVTGWQHDTKNVFGMSSLANDVDTAGTVGEGQLGDFRGIGGSKSDTFNFYIDQVELDLNKTFGENVRIRADLDFGRALSGSGRNTGGPGSNFQLEQGYVTANIPIGNGLEFLIGRFNTPIGLEAVDRADNITLSYTNLYKYLRPHNTTGMKLYYAFNDFFDWHLYVVNNLYDTIGAPPATGGQDTPIPSYGTRFGFTWGQKGKESVVGLSYAGGPEAIARGANLMKHFTHIADLDFSFHVTDAFIIAGEGIYRQDNLGGACPIIGVAPAGPSLPGNVGKNCKALGGNLTFAYNFNETWNGYFRYDYLHDFQGNYTGLDTQIHGFSLGAGYQITEGAKLKMEYRLDYDHYAGAQQVAIGATSKNAFSHGFALEFAYNF
ncbi:MAG: outer membrane beta-barrel protein [bacterium]